MAKIRFREIKKAILQDFQKNNKWDEVFKKPFISEIRYCKSTEEIVYALLSLDFTLTEAYEFILDCISRS